MKTGAKRNYTFYVLMLLIFGGLFWMVIREGKLWDRAFDKTHREAVEMVSGHVAVHQAPASCPAPLELFTQSLHEGVHHPVAMLLLQIISILVAVRIFSWLFKYLGQPGVIGEIVAGIVLGPSLLGHFFPETFGFLFAPDSLESLNILSQIGLILFMFIIGMELDLGILRKKGSQTLVISHASIIVPFFLGTVLAWQVYPEFGFGHTTFVPFALFIGISVSITAFRCSRASFRSATWAKRRWACWRSPARRTTILPHGACWPRSLRSQRRAALPAQAIRCCA